MIPILIVVRVGLGLAHDGVTTRATVISTFRAAVPEEKKDISFSSGGSATVAVSRTDDDIGSRSHLENTTA
jgi:hypothetical protein